MMTFKQYLQRSTTNARLLSRFRCEGEFWRAATLYPASRAECFISSPDVQAAHTPAAAGHFRSPAARPGPAGTATPGAARPQVTSAALPAVNVIKQASDQHVRNEACKYASSQ